MKFRLVTKGDFDGMVCGMLLKELGLIDRVAFVHPRDIEIGRVEIGEQDIMAGLPYQKRAYLAFDHYPGARLFDNSKNNFVADAEQPSTSRVIYNYYGKDKFSRIPQDILSAVDKGYSAQISIDEILYPAGWVLLNYLIDKRSGLERVGRFRLSHRELLLKLIGECRKQTIWEILNIPDVAERLNLYFSSIEEYKAQILRCSKVFANLVVTDIRQERVIYPGNRFMVYALFPECNVSLYVSLSETRGWTTFVAGKSVLDRSYEEDIGEIMWGYDGGGHARAGTCRIKNEESEEVLKDLISQLRYGLLKNLFRGYFNYY